MGGALVWGGCQCSGHAPGARFLGHFCYGALIHAFCMAPFRLGMWTGPFLIGDMDWLLSEWGYGPAPFQLGIWTGAFLVEDTHWLRIPACRNR